MTRVEVSGVWKRYLTQSGEWVDALRGIDLVAHPGELVAVVGHSGCGKTTLLRIVAGLESADRGKVQVGGRQVKGPGSDRAVIFQQSSLMPWRTVRANVAFPLQVARANRADYERRVQSLLEVVGLASHADAYPHELSGGLRQRADVARALAVRPQVLLADEPFGALDAQTRNMIQAEFVRIWQHDRMTVLFVTHSVDEAVFLADRIAVLSPSGHVRADVAVELPRPRDRTASTFVAHRRMVLALLMEDNGRSGHGEDPRDLPTGSEAHERRSITDPLAP